MANRKQEAAAVSLGPQDLPEVVAHRVITDPGAIKALADPLRLRIMRLMQHGARKQARVFTVKQIAAELDEPPTKLYRHIKLLLKNGLIQVAEVRLVGGIVEQHYRVAQAGFSVDPDAGDGLDDDLIAVAGAAIDEFLHRYVDAVRTGKAFLHAEEALAHAPHVPGAGMVSNMRIPHEKAREFSARLVALVEELGATEHDENGLEVNMLTVLYVTE
ncbi:winged helix-turn-helix transcriptional regulator [Actinospica durhamensis]|uniref:Winged helix-turn-helix transcriptional regulator n=1 Tax=Actinospica durhamensis TaxID=1508375 RepID=A0A941EX34_9ACTN|nr:winged helix-turn-helix domain-containing protein [Actinospica durhamensis]MBR7839440.1 winged helix-turn-helix transcriptional regulator [Actinospica durhamensis]